MQVTASKTFSELVEEDGHPAFRILDQSETITNQPANTGFALWLISSKGEIWDSIGNYQGVPDIKQIKTGYANLRQHNKIWRVYTQPLPFSPSIGWLQVAQSLEPISKASKHLLTLMLCSCPLILLVAGFGGLFLAERALSPIDRIIRTAQAISSNDFTQRIGYQGSTDEVGRLAIAIDKMLDRLQAAFEHEQRFTADVSHELRTPLTAIKGRLGVTLSRTRSVEEYESTLQELQREVDRIIRLTNRLLFLSRLEHSESEYHSSLTNIDLSDLLEILIEQIQPMAEIKKIRINVSTEPSLYVPGNSDHLTRLFLNLLDNAIKYTPEEGQVTVRAHWERGQVKVIFTNTGQGIKAEHLPHLFKRFYRADSDRSRDTGGAGLGLAISHEIVRLHQGTIHVTSQPDRLTTFTVQLRSSKYHCQKDYQHLT
ncbi:ATP-binding protein [Scytonema sp. UIC 10036]|uniref:sensor histidine kinase n=1 Tax=Scytonema sp. UIC 10036 TaxID=2304196 RepID=UPI001FAB09F1|nr:ATP-binding protein [Scytonema sp. UIC 10036]